MERSRADNRRESLNSSPERPFLIKRENLIGALVLAVVPAIFLIVTLQLTKVSGPAWLSSNFENNYPYLFNSLLLIKGQTPVMIGHPGTTTQIFGAAILKTSEHGSVDRIVSAVIRNPEKFIKRIQRTLLFFSAASLWLFPWLTALHIQSHIKGLLLQLPSLFFVTLLRYTIWFGSDLMLVPFCVAAICLCVVLTQQRWSGEQRQWVLILAGIVCALGILTKLTFFPLILIIFACCRGLKNRLIAAGSFVLAAAVTSVPIYPKLASLASWTASLASHTGGYGSGEAGFTRPDVLWNGMSLLISNEPMIVWVPLFATVTVLVLQSVGRTASGSHALAGPALMLLGLQILGFILVAKHAGYHYLIPLYLSTGLNLVLVYEAIRLNRRFSVLACFGTGAMGFLLLWPVHDSARRTMVCYNFLDNWRNLQLNLYDRVKKLTKDDLRIDYYRSASPEFAAFFGNGYASNYVGPIADSVDESAASSYFGPLLEERYPHAMFAMFFGSDLKFYTFTKSLDPAFVIERHRQFFLFGNHSDGRGIPGVDLMIPGVGPKSITEVDSGGYLYLDKWTREAATPPSAR